MGFFSNFYPSSFKSNQSASPLSKPGSLPAKPGMKPVPPKPMGVFNLDKTNPERRSSLRGWQWKQAFIKGTRDIPGTSRKYDTRQRKILSDEFVALQKKYRVGDSDGYISPREQEAVLKKMDKERISLIGKIPAKEMEKLQDKIKYGQAMIKGIIKK